MSDERDEHKGRHDDVPSPPPDGGEERAAGAADPSAGGASGSGQSGAGGGSGPGSGRRRRGRSRRGRRGREGGQPRSDERARPEDQADTGAGPADRRGSDDRPRAGKPPGDKEPGAVEAPDEAGWDDEDDEAEAERIAALRRPEPLPEMTLVVYLARSGVGSRRHSDELIRDGRVAVGGTTVAFPREKVPPEAEVTVDGEVVRPREYRYVLVNKPRGVASTRSDPHAERVLVDLVPDGRTLFPVGRLDVDSTGLIILTNDGVLANRLMHPRYGVPKTYVARVRGRVGKRALAELRTGVELEDGRTSPAEARLEKQGNKTALVELTIHEGRKRQVRRMLAALGLPVEELHRRRYGPLSDRNLKVGSWRQLSGDEVEALRRAGEEAGHKAAADDPGESVDLAAPQERAEPVDEPGPA